MGISRQYIAEETLFDEMRTLSLISLILNSFQSNGQLEGLINFANGGRETSNSALQRPRNTGPSISVSPIPFSAQANPRLGTVPIDVPQSVGAQGFGGQRDTAPPRSTRLPFGAVQQEVVRRPTAVIPGAFQIGGRPFSPRPRVEPEPAFLSVGDDFNNFESDLFAIDQPRFEPRLAQESFEPLLRQPSFEPLPQLGQPSFEPLQQFGQSFEPLPQLRQSSFEPFPQIRQPSFEPLQFTDSDVVFDVEEDEEKPLSHAEALKKHSESLDQVKRLQQLTARQHLAAERLLPQEGPTRFQQQSRLQQQLPRQTFQQQIREPVQQFQQTRQLQQFQPQQQLQRVEEQLTHEEALKRHLEGVERIKKLEQGHLQQTIQQQQPTNPFAQQIQPLAASPFQQDGSSLFNVPGAQRHQEFTQQLLQAEQALKALG